MKRFFPALILCAALLAGWIFPVSAAGATRTTPVVPRLTPAASEESVVPDDTLQKSMSLNLNDSVVVNYYLADSGFASAYARIDGVETPMTAESENWYLPVRASAAKELGREITVQPVAVDSAGVRHLGEANTISVRAYAEDRIKATKWGTEDGQSGAKLGRTLIALLNYGAAAQSCFGWQTDDLANKNVGSYQSRMTVYTAEALGAYRTDHLETDDPQGLYYASSCVLGERQALRFYLNLPESTPNRANLTFRASFRNYNGVQRTVEKGFAQLSGTDVNGVYFLEVPGMAAADVLTAVTLTVKNGDAVLATVTDSVAGYCARVYEQDAQTRELVDALLIYGLSALDHFRKPATVELEAFELPVIRVSL